MKQLTGPIPSAQTTGAKRSTALNRLPSLLLVHLLLVSALPSHGSETEVVFERIPHEDATPGFAFEKVPPPSVNDAATAATFTVVSGFPDQNGGGASVLHDGRVPANEDEPGANFFFRAGTEGGAIRVDLGRIAEVQQVNTYSWHAGSRGPQVYTVYFANSNSPKLDWVPQKDADPVQSGWTELARVDTRAPQGDMGGQYGVSLRNPNGILARSRYLLFDIRRTESRDPFGNTFYSEIDVLDARSPEPPKPVAWKNPARVLQVDQGKYLFTIDTSQTPDLTGWTETNLVPMIEKWYPEIVRMLPSPGFDAPSKVKVVFSNDMDGVADTAGGRIRCAGRWFRENLQGEATGAVFHELVHVVQSYGHTPAEKGSGVKVPGWLVEGIADYLRWYHFESDSHGADISRNGLNRVRFDGSYRITANFLDWAGRKYDPELVPKLNAAIRQDHYQEELWTKFTGQPLTDLGAEWKLGLRKGLE